MPTIEDIRKQYPQYGDMSDKQLADALYAKHYSDIPRDQFDSKIGLSANNQPDLSAGDVAVQAVKNIPSSAIQFGKDIAQPFIHPQDTAAAIGNIAEGVSQKLDSINPYIPEDQKTALNHDKEKYADAVGSFLKDRYGGWDNIKKTLATDPVGFVSDLSSVLSLGGGVAARVPGIVGKAGAVAKTAGDVINPINIASGGLGAAGKAAASIVGDVTAQTGKESLIKAAEAGSKGIGSPESKAFWTNYAKTQPVDQIVDQAKSAVANMQQAASDAYKAGMIPVKNDNTVLSFKDVDKTISNLESVGKFKGQELSKSTADVRQSISDAIDNWKNLDPAEYHTPEGFDALKKQIGDIKDNTEYGTPSWKVANDVYNSVRDTIAKQAPAYDKAMSGYAEAKDTIDQVTRELSLKKYDNVGTALRKLQSVMRDNANTSYGYRAQLATKLAENGAPTLPYALAGQQVGTLAPRGLAGRLLASGATVGGTAAAASHAVSPWSLAALPLFSPAAAGAGAYGLGLSKRVLSRPYVGAGAYQAGRLSQ